ncbi:MAG: hypothetical protein ACREJC_08935, partial [Tepidisphaeraceae bacterium]
MNETLIDRSSPDSTARAVRLGEELPIFCEKCGYSLHGLSPSRCGACNILQFHCPECGHHQPINTLRPAFQLILGRMRGMWLAATVAFKIALTGLPLFGWIGMGVEWSHTWNGSQRVPRALDLEEAVAFVIFGFIYGLVPRMLLLRWRSGWFVGVGLGAIAMSAVSFGAWFQARDIGMVDSPFTTDFLLAMAIGACAIVLGAAVSWPAWKLMVKAFLPRRAGALLLEWQRSDSQNVAGLSRAEPPPGQP